MMKRKFACSLCAMVMMPLTTFVQESTGQETLTLFEKEAKNAKNFRLDLSTPTSPGFSVIGASPKEVSGTRKSTRICDQHRKFYRKRAI